MKAIKDVEIHQKHDKKQKHENAGLADDKNSNVELSFSLIWWIWSEKGWFGEG